MSKCTYNFLFLIRWPLLEKEKHIHEFVPKTKTVLETYYATKEIEKKNHLLKSVLEKVTYLRKKVGKEKMNLWLNYILEYKTS